ncbi:hypothetical protein [Mucilaginibacter myungsuensis]|uniref:Uncharacterized protein n=1 Tax=Mucilaginibacter myungsuensis TaxID=649104 RepID=A0A929KYG9_9SPHI|nr:hypothetical protein [Mucilaginibacter myungsuensis]MBE9663999.1 hypothetical protein [Mucilaginibacter myungsuensis]MDN3601178.1 hypothetical protein [Mucilaginibacter myungsuensis]
MRTLDIRIHERAKCSIQDLTKDLDINDLKWDGLFKFLNETFEVSYFWGYREWLPEDKIEKTSDGLFDHIEIDEQHKLLGTLKEVVFLFNRRQLSELWECYEYPAVVFLAEIANEQELFDQCRSSHYLSDLVANIPDVVILYRSFELDVLWIETNINLKYIIPHLS